MIRYTAHSVLWRWSCYCNIMSQRLDQPRLVILIRAPDAASAPSRIAFLAGQVVSGRLDVEVPALRPAGQDDSAFQTRGVGEVSIELIGKQGGRERSGSRDPD